MKTNVSLMLLLSVLVTGCTPPIVGLGAGAAGIYYTRTEESPPPDTTTAIRPHDNWCYVTLGVPECYTKPQPHAEGRLITVDPENKYPLSYEDYTRLSTITPKP